ncbi:MAG: hypothetical protein ABR908_03540 [Terriglobales bacterium]|jgi:hypothetical protein
MRKHKPSWLRVHENLLLGLVSLLLALAPSAAYAAGGAPHCSVPEIDGGFAVTALGQQAGGYAAMVFVMTADGNGNLSGTGTESLNGTVFSNVTVTGTYTASYGCFFTAALTDSLGNVNNFSGVIAQNGYELIGLSADAGTQMQFTAYRLKYTQCTLATIAMKYGAQVQSPLTPSGSSFANEEWAIQKVGTGTDSWVADYNGTTSQGTATATFSVNSNCTYTETVTNNDGTVGHYFGVGGIKLNDVGWVRMATDSGWVSLTTGYFR